MNDDWRLTDQTQFLRNRNLIFTEYKVCNIEWDHDHCEFCWKTFSEYEGDLHEGYVTTDKMHWICPDCYNDFKEIFNWKIVNK